MGLLNLDKYIKQSDIQILLEKELKQNMKFNTYTKSWTKDKQEGFRLALKRIENQL